MSRYAKRYKLRRIGIGAWVGVICVLVVLNWVRCVRYAGRGPAWRFRDRGVIATWVGSVFRSNVGFEEVGNVAVSEVVVSL